MAATDSLYTPGTRSRVTFSIKTPADDTAVSITCVRVVRMSYLDPADIKSDPTPPPFNKGYTAALFT